MSQITVKKSCNNHQMGIDFLENTGAEFIPRNLENIRKTLPELYPEQQEDVLAIENRFLYGKGYLCTNGTGTGKTFVGLGTIKRFWLQGKKDILIVVPTEKKCKDWVYEAMELNLNVHILEGVNDAGFGISVTTYANFYQNEALKSREFYLVVYDECHYLCQNSKGEFTVYMGQHKMVANLPSGAEIKAELEAGPAPEYEHPNYSELRNKRNEFINQRAKDYIGKTKVLFLSATPFAYHKSLLYADGTLWDINEVLEKTYEQVPYNTPTGFDKFLCEHLGYRMKYNKCTIPESGVDIDLLEREFFEKWKEKGVMSTRVLELEKDYSREFVMVNSELGEFIDKGMEMFYSKELQDKYKHLSQHATNQFRYIYVNQLLESIKAREVLERISHHLAFGRKVVVFHSYNHSTPYHPFQFDVDKILSGEDKWKASVVEQEIRQFAQDFPEYYYLDLSDLNNARETIKEHFPSALEFNGTVSKKKRNKNADLFNKDWSGHDLIIVQTKAGREGISFHDKTGEQQRVTINLGLPIAPTQAIQEEGRTYRHGLLSNAIYEYITLHTNFEQIAFATKIAERAKTAENFAMGRLARDLEKTFKEGYVNAHQELPSFDQGTGGKEFDRKQYEVTDFERAITYYYSNMKKTSKNKSSEGLDYYATPEPLGYKMVQWCKPEPNQKGLEPSAGHGAIARWFPNDTANVFVEANYNLASRLSINANGEIKIERFEDLHIVNKYDFIVMNPPFGNSGKLAMEHVAKACRHLDKNYGAKLYAIVPNGASMDKRLQEFYLSDEFKTLHLSGEMILPSVTFERAGTSVSCKIIKIERTGVPAWMLKDVTLPFNQIDLSYLSNIKDFFETIKNLEF